LDRKFNDRVTAARKHRLGLSAEEHGGALSWAWPANTDAVVLGALISGTRAGVGPARIATALGWDLVRVDRALSTLAASLPATGHRLVEFLDGEVQIAPLFELAEEHRRQFIQNAATDARGTTQGQLRVLYQIVFDETPGHGSRVDRTNPAVIELLDRGLLVEVHGQIRAAEFVRFSLRTTDAPSIPFGPAFADLERPLLDDPETPKDDEGNSYPDDERVSLR
jgi:hypothetical protein